MCLFRIAAIVFVKAWPLKKTAPRAQHVPLSCRKLHNGFPAQDLARSETDRAHHAATDHLEPPAPSPTAGWQPFLSFCDDGPS
mmetsp:Transcript_34993/g.71899  ORF Transcript_34993/g.71899 Transcript_34993/m.71899 type:complete len:83 (+) Transcript_34993:559-807(+)